MEKLKIQDLEVGKIYKVIYNNIEHDEICKIGNNKKLYIKPFINSSLVWSESDFSYNELIDFVTFIEIEREIDWSKVPRGTKVQVRANENCKWENRYFIVDIGNVSVFPFKASRYLDDDFVDCKMEDLSSNWKYCRIHPSIEIPDEWYKE